MKHTLHFAQCVSETTAQFPWGRVQRLAELLCDLRMQNGRLFVLGVGGSAANASHAVNDFRKLCGIEAYTPVDNVALLTAITNDEEHGWDYTFSRYLKGSHLTSRDAILVLSVGGGDVEKNVSMNIVDACLYAKHTGAGIYAIVGRDGGYAATVADCAVVVPTVDDALLTPIAESFQSVVLHCVVSHPDLAVQKAKWESMT